MPMDRVQPSTSPDQKSPTVLSIECLKGTSTADEWTGDFLQTGDIVEELRIGNSGRFKSPFKNGKSGVQKVLHESFKKKETSILVRVRRGVDEFAELQACIVPNDSQKKQYMLRSIADPNYAVGFLDRSESDCLQLQGEWVWLAGLTFPLTQLSFSHTVHDNNNNIYRFSGNPANYSYSNPSPTIYK